MKYVFIASGRLASFVAFHLTFRYIPMAVTAEVHNSSSRRV
jgi:hypothetical protein